MRYKLALVATAVVLAGCATVTHMAATGGSRSDGIVKLSFEVGEFDKVDINEADALRTARQRCAVWGYTDADPFEGITRQCQGRGMFGTCGQWFVTKEYQCTMGGSNGPALTQAAIPMAAPQLQPPPMVSSMGPHMVRAKTASGYCLDVPENYVGTGAGNSPAVTSGMPRCDQLSSQANDSPLRPNR